MNITQAENTRGWGWVSVDGRHFETYEQLHNFLESIPEGICDIDVNDLATGNFTSAIVINELYTFKVTYTGEIIQNG